MEMEMGSHGDGWRNVHEKRSKMKTDETTHEVCLVSRVGHCALWYLLKDVQRTVVVPQIQYIALCDATTSSRVFRNCERISSKCSYNDGWSMSLSWCRGFFPTILRIKLMDSPESLVKSQIACVVKNVLCELRFGRKPPINVVSSPPRSFLLKFVETSFWKKSIPLFHYIPPSS